MDLASGAAKPAQVSKLETKILSGEQADVALHAPIIEGRDLGVPGGKAEAGRTDTPLMLMPYVDKHKDGSRTISYRALLSNEDGGTSWSDLYRTQGRASDWTAPFYTVELDPKGKIKDASFEGPLHRHYKFTGERKGERPVLGFASVNNIFTQRTRGAGTLWSGAPQAIMYFNGDSALRRELNAGNKVQLELRDGRLVDYRYNPKEHGSRSTAVLLPEKIKAEDIVGFRDLAGEVFALDEEFALRALPTTTEPKVQL